MRIYNILVLGLLLTACSSSKQTTTTTTPSTPGTPQNTSSAQNALATLRTTYASTPNMYVKGTMSVSGVPVTIWFEAVIKGHDSLRIVLTGPFGMAVGALSATPDKFVFFNAREGEVIEGKPDRSTLSQVMMLSLDYNELCNLMRGELSRFPDSGSYTVKTSGSEMMFTVTKGLQTEQFTLDSTLPAVRQYTRSAKQSNGSVREELNVLYKAFTTVGKRKFPRGGTIDINSGEQKITVNVDNVTDKLDADAVCTINVPKDIPRRKI